MTKRIDDLIRMLTVKGMTVDDIARELDLDLDVVETTQQRLQYYGRTKGSTRDSREDTRRDK